VSRELRARPPAGRYAIMLELTAGPFPNNNRPNDRIKATVNKVIKSKVG